MSDLKAVRTKAGDWLLLDLMSEAEVRAYTANLMQELEVGIAVLQALAAYGKRRWPDREWQGSAEAVVHGAGDAGGMGLGVAPEGADGDADHSAAGERASRRAGAAGRPASDPAD
jgi:hypothetical protein